MGLGIGLSKDRYDEQCWCGLLQNPNPACYQILDHEMIGDWLLVKIKYPDCTNYEGNKILVYKNVGLGELEIQGLIDPHFSDRKDYRSPVARFEPTSQGWQMARKFAATMMREYG